MPWHIEDSNPDCSGYAVVKDDDGTVAGCHETEADAQAQLAALYANEEEMSAEPRSRARPPRDDLYRGFRPGVEIRETAEDAPPVLTGHFARFNAWNRIDSVFEGTFLERIAPGAFRQTFATKGDQIRVLFQHGRDPQVGDKPLGRATILREDEEGPYYEASLLDTSYVRDILPGLRAGVYGASYRFRVVKEDFVAKPRTSAWNPDGIPERTIREAEVFEFGPVTFPADSGATASVRSLTDTYILDRFAAEPERLAEIIDAMRPSAPALPEERAEAEPHPEPESRETEPEPVAPPIESPPPKETTTVEYITRDEKSSRVTELKAELAKLAVEYPGVLPVEAQARWDAMCDEQDALERDIRAWDERQARLASYAENARTTERAYEPPSIIRRPSTEDIYDLTAPNKEPTPERRDQKLRDNAMRAVEQMTVPHFRADQDGAKAALANLLDFSDTDEKEVARRILGTGSPQYRRDFSRYIASGGSERGTALAVGVDGTGGYAVPVAFDPTIIAIGAHTSINPYRAACRVVQIVGTDTWQALTATAVTAAYATEAAAADEQGPTFARPEFVAKRAHAFVTVSYEMAQDRPDLSSELSVLFQEAKDTLEENQFTVGVGTTVYPQGMGLKDAFTRVDSATNDTIAVGDLYLVEAGLPIRHRMNAAWFLCRKAIRSFQAFETTGGQLFGGVNYAATPYPPNRPTGNTGLTLLGYPIWETPSMPYTPTTDDTTAGVLCDPRNYVIVDRIGMSVKVIPDMLNGATPSFPTGEIGVYAFWRGTARVLNADGGRQLAVQ